ncbi:acyltransferase family protein [Prolixibacter sp. NT017]|uniref:acyltransferase family protein n=1 Tax=Prolixibacter sp. NT017 TaxID=2652390 RepID=UPI00127E62D2|nr:acyltransferase family protein [Prolixibacter sp. NT017]GET27099.1 hypothetical protein NT017_34280 [Prolixibacter sp. NT017]
MKTRIYFLDNLRTFLIFLVVLLHAGLVYEQALEGNWIVVDPVKNNSIGLIRMYLDLFVMFSIFFISGYFIPYSLKSKNTWGFVKSKLKRIMLPWLIAVLTLIPAYKAIFLFSRGLPQEAWYTYFHVFQRAGTDLYFFANNPTQNWLWFLPILFMFQLIYLALHKLNLLSFKISLKTGVVLTFVFGVLYGMVISEAGLMGWTHTALFDFQRERLLIYFMSFLLGTLCNKQKVFESGTKNKKLYIQANVVLTFSLLVFTAVALNLFFNIINPGRNFYFVSPFFDRLFYHMSAVLSMLSFLYVLIYAFRFSLNKTNWLMDELNNSSYSVYIIHLVVMGVIAVGLLYAPVPALVKYAVLTILTYAVSNLLVIVYRRVFQPNVPLKLATGAVMVGAFFAFIVIGSQKSATAEPEQPAKQVEVKANPKVSLHEAIVLGDMEAVQQHIASGSDLNIKESSGGSSPLMTAATFGRNEMAMALIEAGADVNFRNNNGSTPLHTAAFFCRTEIVKALLAHGADTSVKNNAGSTALESVLVPFEAVKGIYDYFGKVFGPLGLKLDYERIKTARPEIAKLLQQS